MKYISTPFYAFTTFYVWTGQVVGTNCYSLVWDGFATDTSTMYSGNGFAIGKPQVTGRVGFPFDGNVADWFAYSNGVDPGEATLQITENIPQSLAGVPYMVSQFSSIDSCQHVPAGNGALTIPIPAVEVTAPTSITVRKPGMFTWTSEQTSDQSAIASTLATSSTSSAIGSLDGSASQGSRASTGPVLPSVSVGTSQASTSAAAEKSSLATPLDASVITSAGTPQITDTVKSMADGTVGLPTNAGPGPSGSPLPVGTSIDAGTSTQPPPLAVPAQQSDPSAVEARSSSAPEASQPSSSVQIGDIIAAGLGLTQLPRPENSAVSATPATSDAVGSLWSALETVVSIQAQTSNTKQLGDGGTPDSVPGTTGSADMRPSASNSGNAVPLSLIHI